MSLVVVVVVWLSKSIDRSKSTGVRTTGDAVAWYVRGKRMTTAAAERVSTSSLREDPISRPPAPTESIHGAFQPFRHRVDPPPSSARFRMGRVAPIGRTRLVGFSKTPRQGGGIRDWLGRCCRLLFVAERIEPRRSASHAILLPCCLLLPRFPPARFGPWIKRVRAARGELIDPAECGVCVPDSSIDSRTYTTQHRPAGSSLTHKNSNNGERDDDRDCRRRRLDAWALLLQAQEGHPRRAGGGHVQPQSDHGTGESKEEGLGCCVRERGAWSGHT